MNNLCENDPLTCRCWYHQGHVDEPPSPPVTMPNDTLTAVRVDRIVNLLEAVPDGETLTLEADDCRRLGRDLRVLLALARQARPEPVNERLVSLLCEAIDDYDAENGSSNSDAHWSNRARTALTEAKTAAEQEAVQCEIARLAEQAKRSLRAGLLDDVSTALNRIAALSTDEGRK